MPLFRSRRPARSPRLAASAAASLLALLLAPAASAGEAVVAENGEWGSYGIQTQWIERDARPGDDFDRYVNGKWNASVEMPEDKTRIGAFITLRDLSEDRLKEILEELVSSDNPINDPQDLENIFLKTQDGRFVPMSAVATLKERAILPQLARENQTRSVSITGVLKQGTGLGDALALAEETGRRILPPGVNILALSEAATLDENSSGMSAVFGFAVIIIFLVLAAQFESFVSALIIMTTVPLGLACAVFAMLLTGQTINIYSQIGLVMLVGIMAKNGILIVEFANQLRDEGESVGEAIRNACRIRLRPVMMTMIATVLGGVPLTLAVGAGAEARVALGWVIVGGLGLATLVTLYITPVAYLLFAGLSKPHAHDVERLDREMAAANTNKASLEDELIPEAAQ